jgi:putative transposase
MPAASSLLCPWDIAFQNRHRSARCNTGGRPGERSFSRSDRSAFNFFAVINASGFKEVLRRLVESTQYVSIRYSERLAEAGIEPSVGSTGDSYDNALAETINGLYKAEIIHRRGPWKLREAVELATLEWVSWFNHHRLLEPIGYIPPAEAEANYWRQQATPVTTTKTARSAALQEG